MARKKSSCLKKTLFGCGSIVMFFVLMGFALFISASMNKPKPPERKTLNVAESFSGNSEDPLDIPGATEKGKPVRLKINASMLHLKVQPHQDSKEIAIEGDYDEANYELETKVTERKDEILYEVNFKNKRSFLGMMLQGGIDSDDIDNNVVLKLPLDLLFNIQFEMDMGEADLDFSGLAVSDFTGDFSMGELNVLMREPNQVKMNEFQIESSMGETDVYDFQNYRMAKAKVRSSMGEVRIRNSGDLIEAADVNLKMSMGEMRFEAPPNAKLITKSSVMIGENRDSTRNSADADGPELKVKSNVSLGSLNVSSRYSRAPLTGRLLQITREKGVDAAIAEYHHLRKTRPQYFDFNPRSLNRMGYRLLREKNYDDAIAIFKLNVETHPKYANGYDSLGEAYMKSGNRELAIKYFQKSVELDPTNDNGHEMLAILKNESGLEEGEEPVLPPKAPKPPDPDQN